jgi:hypothetical protein
MMMIRIDLAGLRRTKWQDYAIRLLFGGLIAAAAGLIAQRWGPRIGGLFLAFPAIFPASATLVEKHEKEKKNRAGLQGTVRGREAAALDAAGAVLGCIGLADSRWSSGDSSAHTRPGLFSAALACCGWGFQRYAGKS